MNKVNIWLENLGLKTNICPFLIHFMQSNASLIKKLMMHNDFTGKNLYSVGWAKLSSTSVFILVCNCTPTFRQIGNFENPSKIDRVTGKNVNCAPIFQQLPPALLTILNSWNCYQSIQILKSHKGKCMLLSILQKRETKWLSSCCSKNGLSSINF